MSEIYFIRHGQASFGSKNYDMLSPKGIWQARILGQHLASFKIKFDAVYSGTLDRQKKTARNVMEAYLEKGLTSPGPVIEPFWDEYDSQSIWDHQVKTIQKKEPEFLDAFKKAPNDKKEFQKVFSRIVEQWISGKFDAPGIESWKDFKTRVATGLRSIIKAHNPSKKIAVFSSGGPISAVVQAALGLSDVKTMELSWQIQNASVTRLQYTSTKISLSGFNNISHLELKNDKTLLTYR